jgi:hypothetical protein
MIPEHPDLKDSQIAYETGRVVIRAGRDFKMGEEFFINYNSYASVYDMFRSYG